MNSEFSIIEDCSPYYVRFTHTGIDAVINITNDAVAGNAFYRGFTHHRLDRETIVKIKQNCPLYNFFDLSEQRVSIFVSKPGLYYRAHKDGLNHKFSINYTVKILDDQCVTSWYADEDLAKYKIDTLATNNSRECIDFKKRDHAALKTMTAVPGECILFNTDIFHDWDNSSSKNERMVLTLRLKDYDKPNCSFEDARAILLNLANK
jgi:hypothetical protein